MTFFISKILSSLSSRSRKFDCKCSIYPETESQSHDLSDSQTTFRIFELLVLAEAFSIGH